MILDENVHIFHPNFQEIPSDDCSVFCVVSDKRVSCSFFHHRWNRFVGVKSQIAPTFGEFLSHWEDTQARPLRGPKQYFVAYDTKYAVLMPKYLYTNDFLTQFMNLPDLSTRDYVGFGEFVPQLDAMGVYALQKHSHLEVMKTFGSALEFYHLQNLFFWEKNINIHCQGKDSFIRLHVGDESFWVFIQKDKCVQMVNCCSFSCPEDVGYTLFSLCQNLGIQVEQMPVIMSGLFDKNDQLIKLLGSVLEQILIDAPARAFDYEARILQHPHQRFSLLFNLHACVLSAGNFPD